MRALDRLVDQHCRQGELVDHPARSRGLIVPVERAASSVPAVQAIVDLPVVYPPAPARGPHLH